ncbi:MAG TPA: hypothetical protein VMT39_00650 [Candidatus Bathyarchaeia archaeon]|nr:hypothetical protein [Candidatus Bathyarchaeia archaeon]
MRPLGSHEESTALPRQPEEAGPRRRNLCLYVMVTLLLMAAVLPEESLAKNNNPYFALKGQAMGPDTYEYKLEFTNTAGKTVTIELAVASAGPITDSFYWQLSLRTG